MRRVQTDAAGLFVFEHLPSGAWLLVAVRQSPYAVRQAPARRALREGTHGPTFLPGSAPLANEVEVWVTPIRLSPGQRMGITLTDRARFMVGPVP